MEKFTHGIIAVNPNQPLENGDLAVLHFVGYWSEPQEEDVASLWDELCNDEDFGLKDQIHEIELYPAPQEVVEHYNSVVDWDDVENDETFLN